MIENKRRFLFEWVLYNLLGGVYGICCGFLLFLTVGIIISTFLRDFDDFYFSDVPSLLETFLFLFAFGLCIGIAQAIKLKEVEIQLNKWVMTAACGCSVTSLFYTLSYPHWGSMGSTILALIGAIIIGTLQLVALKNSSRIIGWWLFANVVGLMSLEFLAMQIFTTLDDFPRNFAWTPIFISLIATFFLPIPTGLVLLKYLAQVPSPKVVSINESA